jgi:hypothetical protein
MDILAALAHTAAPTAPAFNGLFYATVATIIPVLFLAIAVQGRMHENVLKAADDLARRVVGSGPEYQKWVANFASTGALGIAIFIVVYGAAGEIEAVIALFNRHPALDPTFVLQGTIFLTAAAAAGPGLALAKSLLSMFRVFYIDLPKKMHSRQAPQSQRQPPQRSVKRPVRTPRQVWVSTRNPQLPKWAKQDTRRTQTPPASEASAVAGKLA